MSDDPYPEFWVAAKWWADCLRKPPIQDNGDTFQSAFATLASATVKPLTERQIDSFQAHLWIILGAEFGKSYEEAVEKKMSNWGAYTRTIGVDYHPDLLLQEAADKSEIDVDLRLPIKTVMWINPGEVKVAVGYGAKPVVIYSKSPTPPIAGRGSEG